MNECSVPAMNQVLLRAQGKNLRKHLTHCTHMLFWPFGAGPPWPEWRRLTGASPHPTGGRVCRFRQGHPSPALHSFPVHPTSNTSGGTGGGWMAWMPENGGGRDARSMAPTTASAPPLVGYLVSNCSSGFKPAFFRPYLPRGSWKCRKSGVRLFLDLICIRFILLGFAGALRLFVFQQKWRRHGQSEDG